MKDISEITACVIDQGTFYPVAERLSREYKKVYYHKPDGEPFETVARATQGAGFPAVEYLDDFWEKRDEIDLFVFPDCAEWGLQKELRRQGFPVWGSGDAGKLEQFRGKWLDFCKAMDLPMPPTERVRGLSNLSSYIKENSSKHLFVKISRFRGDMETWEVKDENQVRNKLDYLALRFGPLREHILFYVQEAVETDIEAGTDTYNIHGQWPDEIILGYEKKGESYFATVKPRKSLPDVLWRGNIAITQYFMDSQYANFVSSEIRVKDDVGSWLDPCFSEDTEILTDHGWKRFPDLNGTELVATLTGINGHLEYQQPTDYISHYYTGNMVGISDKKQTIECLVTPNHAVWRTDRFGKKMFNERADSLTGSGFIPRTAKWSGESPSVFIVPAYEHHWSSGRYNKIFKSKICEPVKVLMPDWLEFLALYLSEGSLHGKWGINITQFKHKKAVGEMLNKLPFSVTESNSGFVVHSTQLVSCVSDFGKCHEKRVPDYVKRLSPELINVFLNAYCLGDGSFRNGARRIFTTSKGMSDDLQELFLKSGTVASISVRQSKDTEMSVGTGKTYFRNHDIYCISERPRFKKFWFETFKSRKSNYISHVPYNGMVYDVTVPNRIVYVRRKGKPFWSGNCLRCPSPAGEEQLEMLSNFPEIVWHGANGRLVQPEWAAKFCGEAVIAYNGDRDAWKSVAVPEDVQKWIKLYAAAYSDGAYHFPPGQDHDAIGCAVAIGNTPTEVLDNLKELAEAMKDQPVTLKIEPLNDIFREVDKAEEEGIPFSSKHEMPQPSEVLDE